MRKRIYAWFMTLVLSITSISSTSIIYADDFSDETEVMTEDEGTEEEDITDDSEIDFDSEEDASINEEQIEEDESEESQDEVTIECTFRINGAPFPRQRCKRLAPAVRYPFVVTC